MSLPPSEITPLMSNENSPELRTTYVARNDSGLNERNPSNFRSRPMTFLSSIIASKVAPALQNSGSVARDHLASERTFLAYVRTSLSIASAGVALSQFLSMAKYYPKEDRPQNVGLYARSIGATTIILALLVLLIGVVRYFSVQNALVKGFFPAARVTVGFMATLLGALVVAVFGVLFAGRIDT